MTTKQPTRVYLHFVIVQKRGADIQGRTFVRTQWIARGTGTTMYQSKECAALSGNDAREAARKLALAWLDRENRRPAMSANVIAAMEWTGPRYVDTTSEVKS